MNEKYSFIDLFSKSVDLNIDTNVEIGQVIVPKIQRPYAQGRLDGVCTYVRNTFLNEIFEAFSNKNILELNFIYGIVRPSNDIYVMELLDGQQRMTTLFLLHWYIVNRELHEDDEMDTIIRSCLSKFIYETRSTSTVFCQKLSNFRIDLSSKTPKEAIRSAKWYFKSFDRDSTIAAMLTMLDAIHEHYERIAEPVLYTQLSNLQFYVKSLGLFNLSEELYIKMNARGLQLSPFENFKADLTNFVSNHDYDGFKKATPLYKKDSNEIVPFHTNFSIKLDAKWIDIFWQQGTEDFDVSYMSFISRFFACKYIVNSKESVKDRDMRVDSTIKKLYTEAEEHIDSNEYLGFQIFEQLLEQHPEYLESLDLVFDVFHGHHRDDISKEFIPRWDRTVESSGDDFYCHIDSKMTHVKLIVFAAAVEYMDAYKAFDKLTFTQWMRVVWNVVENTNIDGLTPLSSLIRKFSALIHYIANCAKEDLSFYKALSLWRDDHSDERESRTIIEEVEKAKRISEDLEWEAVFIEAESHPYFKGMVLFFYTEGMSINEFEHRLGFAQSMFDEDGIAQIYRKKHLLIRAIVSQFVSWDELRERYITERGENNKYLKNILASHTGVRSMLAEALSQKDETDIKDKLAESISTAQKVQPWANATDEETKAVEMAVNRLRADVRMYDWIASEEVRFKACFRIYFYEGHIMFAIPRKQYVKIAIDTERGKIAKEISEAYGFEFCDANQRGMFDLYGDCFGNEIWLTQERRNGTVWIGFCQHHELKLQIECNTKKMAKDLLSVFNDSQLREDDERWLFLASENHSSKSKTYKVLSNRIEKIFEGIAQLESKDNLIE